MMMRIEKREKLLLFLAVVFSVFCLLGDFQAWGETILKEKIIPFGRLGGEWTPYPDSLTVSTDSSRIAYVAKKGEKFGLLGCEKELETKELGAIYIEARPRYDYVTADVAPSRWMDLLLFPPDFAAIAAYGSRTFVRIGMEILEAQVVFLGLDEIRGPITADYIVSEYPSPTLGYGYAGNMISVVSAGSRRDVRTSHAGVLLDYDVTVKKLTTDAVSWGDPDGFGDLYTKAGYVGVANLAVSNVRMDGAITINAVRLSPAKKFVYVSLAPGTVVSMGSFIVDAMLDSAKTLDSPYAQTLGIFGVSGLKVILSSGVNIKVYAR